MKEQSGREKHVRVFLALICLAMVFGSLLTVSADDSSPVRFAVIGDRTGGHTPGIYGQIIQEIERLRPDFVITVGDMIEGYTDDTVRLNEEWAEYKALLTPLTMPIYHTSGNHDILSDVQADEYRRQIGKPYYSFDRGPIHFIILETGRWETSKDLPTEQIAWLIADLEANRSAEKTIVFMHKPYWYNSTALGKPDTLHTLFFTYGVDAVFTGHYHQYFTGKYNGITYTGIGSSGAEMSWSQTQIGYHYCWVAVDKDDIVISPINMGSVYPWDEITAKDMRLINTYEKFAFDQPPLKLNADLKFTDGQVAVTIHNYHDQVAVNDTLRWDLPDGWTMTPVETPVIIEPGAEATYTFAAKCSSSLYPAPTASLNFPFVKGRTVPVQTSLRLARTMNCTKTAMPPAIDGNIAEPIWENPEIRFFSDAGGAAETDPVGFYFAYDENNLYVAAKCMEAHMDSLAFSTIDHDGPVYGEDCVGFFIQPDINRDVAYQIYFNPMGTAFDQKLTRNETGYMDADRGWNGTYTAKAIHGPDYWVLEAAIPLAQFGTTGRPGKKIGINFRRKQHRLGQNADWQAPIDYDPKSFGIMTLK